MLSSIGSTFKNKPCIKGQTVSTNPGNVDEIIIEKRGITIEYTDTYLDRYLYGGNAVNWLFCLQTHC